MAKRMIYFVCSLIALLTLGLESCDRPMNREVSVASPWSNTVVATASPLVPALPTAADRAAATTLRQQGLDYRSQERYDEAIAMFQQSVQLDPTNLSGRVLLGWTLHLTGQETAAAEQLQQALVQHPDAVTALNALGIVYLVSGNLDAAVQTHQKAVALQPDNEIGYYNLSLAYQRLQRYPEAIANAQRATELEPENPHPWVALAIAYWGKHETALAQDAYRQAIRLDNRYRDAAILDRLTVAGFSLDQIQLSKTIQQSQ